MTPEILEKLFEYVYEVHTDFHGGRRHSLQEELREMVKPKGGLPPSAFVSAGPPMCSRWGSAQAESLAFAYVRALELAGDTWGILTPVEVKNLLHERGYNAVRAWLDPLCEGTASPYISEIWHDIVRNLTGESGARAVEGNWRFVK